MNALVLNVTGIYFEALRSGEKTHEFRMVTPHWERRITGRKYDTVIIAYGYPKKGRIDRLLKFKWKGYDIRTITHPHFGPKPVTVFAIDCTERIQ